MAKGKHEYAPTKTDRIIFWSLKAVAIE